MRYLFLFLFICICLLACTDTANKIKSSSASAAIQDSGRTMIDTLRSHLKDSILNHYYQDNDTSLWSVQCFDSLDLNFDGINDLVVTIDYGGISSVGYDLDWDVYYYDGSALKYTADTLMRNLPNPEFDTLRRRLYVQHIGRNEVSAGSVYIWAQDKWVEGRGYSIGPSFDSLHTYMGYIYNGQGDDGKQVFFDGETPSDSLWKDLHKIK